MEKQETKTTYSSVIECYKSDAEPLGFSLLEQIDNNTLENAL